MVIYLSFLLCYTLWWCTCISFLLCYYLWGCVSPFCYPMISGDVSLLSAIIWSLVMCHFFLLCHDLWWCTCLSFLLCHDLWWCICLSFLLCHDLWWCVTTFCYTMISSDVPLLSAMPWSLVMCICFLLCHDLCLIWLTWRTTFPPMQICPPGSWVIGQNVTWHQIEAALVTYFCLGIGSTCRPPLLLRNFPSLPSLVLQLM